MIDDCQPCEGQRQRKALLTPAAAPPPLLFLPAATLPVKNEIQCEGTLGRRQNIHPTRIRRPRFVKLSWERRPSQQLLSYMPGNSRQAHKVSVCKESGGFESVSLNAPYKRLISASRRCTGSRGAPSSSPSTTGSSSPTSCPSCTRSPSSPRPAPSTRRCASPSSGTLSSAGR